MLDEGTAQIQALMNRYNICGDRGDIEGLTHCFAPDGRLIFPGAEANGRDEIVTTLTQGERNPQLKRVRHHLTTSQILIAPDGKSATGRTYFLVITNEGPDHSGVYVDMFSFSNEGWRIQKREVRIDWQSETSLFRPFGAA